MCMLTSGRCAALCSVQVLKTRLQNSTGSSLRFLRWPDNSSSPCGSAGRTPGAAARWASLVSGWAAGRHRWRSGSHFLTRPKRHHTCVKTERPVRFYRVIVTAVRKERRLFFLRLQPARSAIFFGDAPWGGSGWTGVSKVPEELHRVGLIFGHGQEGHLSVGGVSFLLCVNLYCVEPKVFWFLIIQWFLPVLTFQMTPTQWQIQS